MGRTLVRRRRHSAPSPVLSFSLSPERVARSRAARKEGGSRDLHHNASPPPPRCQPTRMIPARSPPPTDSDDSGEVGCPGPRIHLPQVGIDDGRVEMWRPAVARAHHGRGFRRLNRPWHDAWAPAMGKAPGEGGVGDWQVVDGVRSSGGSNCCSKQLWRLLQQGAEFVVSSGGQIWCCMARSRVVASAGDFHCCQ